MYHLSVEEAYLLISTLWPKLQAFNSTHNQGPTELLSKRAEVSKYHLCTLSLPYPRSVVSPRKELVHVTGTLASVAAVQKTHSLIAWLWWPAGLGFIGMGANKETVLNQLSDQGSVQKEQTETPISQSCPEIDIFANFISCSLRIQQPISLSLYAY